VVKTIKTTETLYKGRFFRSTLEAKWAVFFDAVGILWEYENKDYETPNGNYLPTFCIYLRGYENPGWLFEVKPLRTVLIGDKSVCLPTDPGWFDAVQASGIPLVVACGIPSGQQVEKWVELTGGLHILGKSMLGGKHADDPEDCQYRHNMFGICECCDRIVIGHLNDFAINKQFPMITERVRTALDTAKSASFEYEKQGIEDAVLAKPRPSRVKKTAEQSDSHVLYRFYDDTEQLLYVGITANPPQRFKAHRADKHWWSTVSTVRLQTFMSRRELESAEREAIKSERPIYNVTHNRDGSAHEVKPTVNRNSSLVGQFFHTTNNCSCGRRIADRQGHIIKEPADGVLLIEVFEWVLGEPNGRELITLSKFMDMNPILYANSSDMRYGHDHGAVSHTQDAWKCPENKDSHQ